MKLLWKLCFLLATTVAIINCTETFHGTTSDGKDCNCACEREAVLLHEIKELDFVKGAYTVSRRLPAIPQLDCVGGSAQGVYEPGLVRCVNTGITAPHWRCEATLDKDVQLGSVTVTCEGYTGLNDPYILRGSCGLQYNLEYTNWTPYLWGKFVRALSILILTPLKWLGFIALGLFGGLVALAAIRRPARRNRRAATHETTKVTTEYRNWPLTWLQDPAALEEEEETSEIWTGRLRPRSKKGVPSPSSPARSPSSPQQHNKQSLHNIKT